MAKLKEFLDKYTLSIIILFIGIAFLATGFFVPPMGVIDGSVLTAVGEIFAFTAAVCGISKYGEVSKMKYNQQN